MPSRRGATHSKCFNMVLFFAAKPVCPHACELPTVQPGATHSKSINVILCHTFSNLSSWTWFRICL